MTSVGAARSTPTATSSTGTAASSTGSTQTPDLTRVAVISDTHMPRGARSLPRECVRRLEAAELILHAGDFVTGSVLEALRELGPVEAVVGNMDELELRTLLPERRVVEVAGLRIGMLHDAGPRAGRPERLAAMFPDCAAVVYGHTHVTEVTQAGETWILNPGSPTERRSAPHRSMLELEVRDADLTVRTYVL